MSAVAAGKTSAWPQPISADKGQQTGVALRLWQKEQRRADDDHSGADGGQIADTVARTPGERTQA